MSEDNRLVRNAVLNHLSDTTGGAIWGQAWGFQGDTDSDGNASGLDRDGYGILLGADVAVGEGAALGIAANYSETDLDLDERTGSGGTNLGMGTVETVNVMAYLGVEAGGLNIRAGGGYGWTEVTTDRNVAFGVFTDPLVANYDGSVTFGFLEAGYPVDLGGGQLEPYVGLSFVEANTDAFSETGGTAALRFEGEVDNASAATLGLRFATADTGSFQLSANGGWQHNLGDLAPESTANFATGSSFRVAGAEQSQNAGFVQVEASFNFSENGSIGVSYDGLYGDASQDHAGVLRVTIGF
jgi:outer membrane autotransporter protein